MSSPAVVGASLVASYLAAVLVNTVRISIGVWLGLIRPRCRPSARTTFIA